jgi:hypothetical protein
MFGVKLNPLAKYVIRVIKLLLSKIPIDLLAYFKINIQCHEKVLYIT